MRGERSGPPARGLPAALQGALVAYSGALVVATHDDALAGETTDSVLALPGLGAT